MIKITSLEARRDFTNMSLTPEGHWVRLTFMNDHGVHTLELNGRSPLPADPTLLESLQFMLWDYGLLEQSGSRTAQQRLDTVQRLIDEDSRNHVLGREYLHTVGAPLH